jgi:hypothetical protein
VQIVTGSNREGRETSSQTAVEITILRLKGMKILQRDWRGIYRHNFSYKRKQNVGRFLK